MREEELWKYCTVKFNVVLLSADDIYKVGKVERSQLTAEPTQKQKHVETIKQHMAYLYISYLYFILSQSKNKIFVYIWIYLQMQMA